MTNNEIIFENVRASFTPAQLAELVNATYTADQLAARRANVTITVDEGNADTAEDIFTAMLAADQFHTFAEWNRMGYSVKKGRKIRHHLPALEVHRQARQGRPRGRRGRRERRAGDRPAFLHGKGPFVPRLAGGEVQALTRRKRIL